MQTSTIQQESIRGGCSLCFIQSSLLIRYYRPISFIALKVTDKVSDICFAETVGLDLIIETIICCLSDSLVSDMFPTFVTDMFPTFYTDIYTDIITANITATIPRPREDICKKPPTLPIYNKVGREREGGKREKSLVFTN